MSSRRQSACRAGALPEPILQFRGQNAQPSRRFAYLVGMAGFEPATPWSQTRCATGLRYMPDKTVVSPTGVEPVFTDRKSVVLTTRRWRRRHFTRALGRSLPLARPCTCQKRLVEWRAKSVSDSRPQPWHGCALPKCYFRMAPPARVSHLRVQYRYGRRRSLLVRIVKEPALAPGCPAGGLILKGLDYFVLPAKNRQARRSCEHPGLWPWLVRMDSDQLGLRPGWVMLAFHLAP